MEASFLVAASQRRSVRRYVRLECEVVRERGFKLLGRRALDVSTTGLRVAAMDHALTGEPVVLAFRAPGTDSWIDAEGTVARVVHGRRGYDFGPSIAVDFAGLPEELRALLRRQLSKFPPAAAKRGPRIDFAASVRRIGAS
jgi:hypothetical protein